MFMRKLFWILFMLPAKMIFSQAIVQPTDFSDFSKKINIIPPSPIAASLGTYGGNSPDLITGAIKVSLPLYSLTTGSHSLPISLNYHSTGLKVDEIQAQVGAGWSLSAGGVISRTILGSADETAERIIPPSDINNNRREFNWFLQKANVAYTDQVTDAQPDIFSFNFPGYSGSFILDRALSPVQLNHSNIRIEKNFSENAEWNFRITTGDGVQYLFGGANFTEYTKSGQQGCGLNHPAYKSTAWYISSIIYPDGDKIDFTYERVFLYNRMNVSETMFHTSGSQGGCPGATCPALSNTSCVGYFNNSTLLISGISTNRGATIKFGYQTRRDFSTNADLGDQLLSNIKIYDPYQSIIKTFSFSYNNIYSNGFSNAHSTFKEKNRSFLTAIGESGGSGPEVRNYKFEYEDVAGLPSRLSFAQDHWGYFNGRNNSTLIPKPSSLNMAQKFPLATADREPNEGYAKKGLLKKIIYPTGGYEEFEYESNTVNKNLLVYPPATNINIQSIAGDVGCVFNSQSFSVPFSQATTLNLSVDATIQNPDPLHCKAIFNLYHNGNAIYNVSLSAGQTKSIIVDLVAGQNYELRIQACKSAKGNASLNYFASAPQAQPGNQKVGGLRVSKVSSVAGIGAPVVKRILNILLWLPLINLQVKP